MASFVRSVELRAGNEYYLKQISERTKVEIAVIKRVFDAVMEYEIIKIPTKEPPPEGGVSISKGSRIHHINKKTISRWVKKGYIPILRNSSKETYIDAEELAKLVEIYKRDPGQGKKTLKEALT